MHALRRSLAGLALLLVLASLLTAWQLWRELSGGAELAPPPAPPSAESIERGAYLARIGNCQGCHTAPGGAAYAGGRAIETPFGTVFASNLTPDPAHGIGSWSDEAFWRALHEGRSRDGRLLYPAFPYPNTTHVSRSDSDAIHAYLRSLPAVAQTNRSHALRSPYDSRWALAAWRLLFFRPAETGASNAPQDRGAYLVRGLGHCSACHARRNAFGASADALQLDGGLMPGEPWLAPSLLSPREAGLADWPIDQITALLTTGVSQRGSVQGPMAEVVHGSTQYLSPDDARAMAGFLKSLPQSAASGTGRSDDEVADARALRSEGERLYADHCAGCHGDTGLGVAGAYPALAGNRALLIEPPVNLVQVIVHGGFAPVTAGNPRPYGMPPFGLTLTHRDIAALITYLRSAWGHQAPAVSALTVQRWREAAAR